MEYRVATVGNDDDNVNKLNQSPQLAPRLEIVLKKGQGQSVILFMDLCQVRVESGRLDSINLSRCFCLAPGWPPRIIDPEAGN